MKRFTLLKVSLMLVAIFVTGIATAQDIIFKETFGEGDAGKAKIAAYTGYDNKNVTFEGVSATDGDIRSTSVMNNHVWLPAKKLTGIIIKGINTTGCSDMTLSFDATVNVKDKPYKVTIKANGTAITYPAITIVDPTKFQTIVCIDKLPESASLDLEISAAAEDNLDGYRIDNITIKGKKGGVSVPSVTVSANVDFPIVKIGQTSEKTINISGSALTGDLAVSILGEGFTTTTTTIAKATAEAGTTMKVTFAPTEAKIYAGTISISGGGLAAPVIVALAGTGFNMTGAGTVESPYTVADVIALNNADKGPYVVKGYIVGTPTSDGGSQFSGEFTFNTALYIADNAEERDLAKLVPVQLTDKPFDIRTEVNLKDHPENLGRLLTVTGELVPFYSVPGIKKPTAFTMSPLSDEPTIQVLAAVKFPNTFTGKQSPMDITVKGFNLTGDITVALSGDGFSTAVTKLTKAEAEAGASVEVTFAPTAVNNYSGTLTFTGGGLEAPVVAALTGKGVVLVGEGTSDKPYTVADVIALNNTAEGPFFVKGIIVGAPVFAKASEFIAPFTTNTALYLGDEATERDTMMLVPVQLTPEVRAELNLVDHPENIGKTLIIKGKLVPYFSAPGLKNTTEYQLDATSISAVEAANTIISVNGNLVVNAQESGMVEVYNMVGQKVKTVSAKEGYNEVTGLSAGQVYVIKFAGKTHKVVL